MTDSIGVPITFEGIGGSGKSTLAAALVQRLKDDRIPVVATREPGGTPLGVELRRILLEGKYEPASWTEAFLFEADRAQTYQEIIAPALQAGAVVVSDRSFYGTFAYQGYGSGLDTELIGAMSQAAMEARYPDLIFVIDIEPQLARERKLGSLATDRFDERALEFQEQVRRGYLTAAERDRERGAVVLDGSRPRSDLVEEVVGRVLASLRH